MEQIENIDDMLSAREELIDRTIGELSGRHWGIAICSPPTTCDCLFHDCIVAGGGVVVAEVMAQHTGDYVWTLVRVPGGGEEVWHWKCKVPRLDCAGPLR